MDKTKGSYMNKYRNKKTEGYDSGIEYKRSLVLKQMEQDGIISELRQQVRYELIPPIHETEIVQLKTKTKTVERCIQRSIDYVADFAYIRDGELIVEDVKGSKFIVTSDFKIKCKMMFYFHKIKVRIVYGKKIKDTTTAAYE